MLAVRLRSVESNGTGGTYTLHMIHVPTSLRNGPAVVAQMS